VKQKTLRGSVIIRHSAKARHPLAQSEGSRLERDARNPTALGRAPQRAGSGRPHARSVRRRRLSRQRLAGVLHSCHGLRAWHGRPLRSGRDTARPGSPHPSAVRRRRRGTTDRGRRLRPPATASADARATSGSPAQLLKSPDRRSRRRPARNLSPGAATITTRNRRRKATGRGTWRGSPGNSTPPGAGVGRVCWAVGGLPPAELHRRWLVGGDDDCGRLAGSTGFGPARSPATAGTFGRTLASRSGCSGSQLSSDTPRHGVGGTDLQWAKPKGASGGGPAAMPERRYGLADGSKP
jgi:hypothetical protein